MDRSVLARVLWSRGLRAFADGFVSLLLPVYLLALGFGPLTVGVVATVALLGSGVLTLVVGFNAHRFELRSLLVAAAVLMAATGVGFAAVTDLWPLLAIACVGTLNPSSGGASVFVPLEHAVIARSVQDTQRTGAFARYSLIGSLVAALGALLAATPELLTARLGVDQKRALQAMFVLYAAFGVAAAMIYASLPQEGAADREPGASSLTTSRPMVLKLAALFSLDSFAGGLVLDAMLVLWLHEKFAISPAVTGMIFFWTGVLSAFSYLVAVRLAARIGLVNTMVFTHLPSSVFLILVPFVPSLGWAIGLLLARSALSQMDVPTRTSYVMAIVPPSERAAAATVTTVPRSFASAAGPIVAGSLLGASSFGWPLVVAGALKIAYDLMLLYVCRNVRPPEEARPPRERSRPAQSPAAEGMQAKPGEATHATAGEARAPRSAPRSSA